MEHVVHTLHGVFQRAFVAYVANVELNLIGHFGHASLKIVPHVILLLLIAAEDTDFTNVGAKESVKYGIAEAPCTSSYKEDFVFKYAHKYF
jgi:hypothetical protein